MARKVQSKSSSKMKFSELAGQWLLSVSCRLKEKRLFVLLASPSPAKFVDFRRQRLTNATKNVK